MSIPPKPDSNPDKPRALSHSIFDTMLSSGSLIAITLITGAILARMLGPEGRGIYGSVIFWCNFGASFLTFSIFQATVIRLRNRGEHAAQFLPTTLGLSAAITLLASAVAAICIFSGLIEVEGIRTEYLIVFVLANLAIAMAHKAFHTIEAANLRFGIINIDRAVSPALLCLALAGLFIFDITEILVVIGLYIATKIPMLFVRLYRFRHHLRGKIDTELMVQSAKLGLKMNLARAAIALSREADKLVIIPLWSAQMLGYYFVAVSTCGAAMAVAGQAIQITLLPSLAGLSPEEKRDKIERLIRLSTIATVGVVIGLWLTAPYLVPLVFGEDFQPAVAYAQGLVFASALRPIISILNITHFSGERTLPGVHMAIAFGIVFGAGFLLTGFDTPNDLFIALGLGNVATILTGIYHLQRDGLVRIGWQIIPGPKDVTLLCSTLWRYGTGILLKPIKRIGK